MTRAGARPRLEGSQPRDLFVETDLRRGRLRRSLREGLRASIQDHRLAVGTVLPSSRRLALDLGISRGVVTDVYDQLASEGYLIIRPRSAPIVAPVVAQDRALSPRRIDVAAEDFAFDFVATSPDVSLFPRRAYVRAVEHALAMAPDRALDYGDHRGRSELRTALAVYLARVRGIRTDPSRIIVTSGFTQALSLICAVISRRGGQTVAIESPSLPDEWATVRASGLRLVGCPIDDEGLTVDRLGRPDAIIVTPAHQFPMGVVMSPLRRQALVAWAQAGQTLIIEDDYDAEFRYDRTPMGAIQGLDPNSVAHVGTASKTMAPAIRLGWLTVPAGLTDEIVALKRALDGGIPAIAQLAFADLLTSGEYERIVGRTRQIYRRRRDRLVRAVSMRMPGQPILGAAAGLHVVLCLPTGLDDVEIAHFAARRGVGVQAISTFHVDTTQERGLILGFGRLPEEKIDRAVDELVAAIGSSRKSRPRLVGPTDEATGKI